MEPHLSGQASLRACIRPGAEGDPWRPPKPPWRTCGIELVAKVKWWNTEGRFIGPKAPEVRQFMLDPDNYELQLRGSIVQRVRSYRTGTFHQNPA